MDVRLNPTRNNEYPLHGLLIKGQSPAEWVKDLEDVDSPLTEKVYALPGLVANSLWGCLAISRVPLSVKSRHDLCQQVSDKLYIPERSKVSPELTDAEISKMFLEEAHLFHPELGLVPLGNPIDWLVLISDPILNSSISSAPQESTFIPQSIVGFFKQPIPKEEIEEELEKPVTPKKLESDPLTMAEKAKLKAYKAILGKKDKNGQQVGGKGVGSGGGMSGGGLLGGALGGLLGDVLSGLGSAFAGLDTLTEGMMKDMEELERRNKNELDKLLDLMENNPEEALKYAIPLDNDGTMRGGSEGLYNMTRMRNDFSLFGNDSSSGSGGSLSNAEHFMRLNRQYNAAAEKLIKEKKYEKAAFIYMKLLKNYDKAAETLLLGKFYEQAAFVYLKYAKNKEKAAECYEKGMFYEEAIELYIELKKHEKAGDLLLKSNLHDEAMDQYDLLAISFLLKSQYLKASFVYKDKMNDPDRAKEVLLKGWTSSKDAYNCLNNYLGYFGEEQECIDEIRSIYENHTERNQRIIFIKVLSHEYKNKLPIRSEIREIAYEAISEVAKSNPSIVDHLISFNDKDSELKSDANRYKTNATNRRQGLSRMLK